MCICNSKNMSPYCVNCKSLKVHGLLELNEIDDLWVEFSVKNNGQATGHIITTREIAKQIAIELLNSLGGVDEIFSNN